MAGFQTRESGKRLKNSRYAFKMNDLRLFKLFLFLFCFMAGFVRIWPGKRIPRP